MTRYNKLDVLGILQEHGALLDGHYRMPSGLHTERFVETALVLQYPHLAQKLAKALSDKFPGDVDVVVSPAMGGVVLGQEVARARRCRHIFFERRGDAMGLRRSFRLERGERALIVEDVLMAGRTTAEVLSILSVDPDTEFTLDDVVIKNQVRCWPENGRAMFWPNTVGHTPRREEIGVQEDAAG